MKYILLVVLSVILFSEVSSQVKKPVTAKAGNVSKTNPVNTTFLKRKFVLDPVIFTASSVDTSNDNKKLNIKIGKIKSAKISISNASSASAEEMTETLENVYDAYRFKPDATGYTFEKIYTGKSTLSYGNESITPVEYKLVYHGTKNQQELDKAMALMPKARDLNAKPASSKPVNQYDTDENNQVVRIYMLPYSPGVDKGFMMLSYEANYGDDQINNGAAVLQTLITGISRMKINEQITFSKVKDTKNMIDVALPALSTGDNGRYSFPTSTLGSLLISSMPNATTGYVAPLENYSVNYGSIVKKSDIVEEKLQSGIRIYSRTFTIENKSDDYTTVRYQVVSVLVPDKKIIKNPLLITLTSYSSDQWERNSLNAFILNSISLPGTLTKGGIDKTKEVYALK